MAKLPATGLTFTAIKSNTGLSSNNLSELNEATSLNQYSFYSPGDPEANVSTKIIENKEDTAPNKMGDFRNFDQASTAGTSGGNFDYDLFEGTDDDVLDTVVIEFKPEFEELNYKSLNSSINSIIVQLYDDAGYSSPIGSADVTTITESTMSPAPPAGHSDQETKIIKVGSNNWPQLTLTNPWSYPKVYAEIFLSDGAISSVMGQTADYQVEVTLVKNLLPKVTVGTIDWGGEYGAYSKAIGFSASNLAALGTSFIFTAHAYVQSGPGGGSGCPDTFQYILADWDITYVYDSIERDIQLNVQGDGDQIGSISVNGPLYNAGDGTDVLDYGEIRSINFTLISASGFGECFSSAPPSTHPTT